MIKQVNNPNLNLMPEWSDKLQRKISDYGIYSFQLKNAVHFGGGGTDVQYVDPYAGTGIRELYKKLSGWIGPQIGQGVSPYPGQVVPGVSPMQQTGFDVAATGMPSMATGAMGYFQDVLGQQAAGGGPYQQLAGTTLESLMQPWNPEAETEYWEQAWKAPAMQTWQQDIIPQIMERYGAGGVGGALGRELGRSGEDLATMLSGQLANILYSGQQAQLGRQQAGVGQAMQMAGLPGQLVGQAGQIGGMGTDILSQFLNIGAQQRGISGELLQEPYQKWAFQQPWANPYLTQFLGTMLQQPPMQTYAQQQGPGMGAMMMPALGAFLGSGGLGASGLGGFASGLFSGPGSIVPATTAAQLGGGLQGLLSSLPFISDVRLKENFDRIDNALEKVNQLEGHTYNFKGQDDRTGGLIAQELEMVMPEAVIEIDSIKHIRLDAVVALLVNAVKELNQKIELISPTLN